MSQKFDMSGYVDVAERIAQFREKHPEGSLQPANLEEPFRIVEVGGALFIVYAAAAYRTDKDRRPGIGVAWEVFPGKTPYTKDSELQNAETSAWGRAIVAVLAADTRASGVASRDEVQNRQRSEPAGYDGPPLAAADEVNTFLAMVKSSSEEVRAGMNTWWKQFAAGQSITEDVLDRAHQEHAFLVDHQPGGFLAEGAEKAAEPGMAPSDQPDPATPSDPPSEHRYDGFKKADLQGACQVRGIAETGTVEELHARLRSADEAEVGPSCHLAECPLAASTKSEAGVLHCPEHEPF